MIKEKLREGANELNISLSFQQLEQFEKYYLFLEEEGKKHNLTRIKGEDVVPLHFLDSLIGLKYMDFQEGDNLLDIGSGAGFPGVPLKILNPKLKLDIIDSSLKKLNFIDNLAKILKLEDINTFHGRAEDLGQEEKFRQKYSWVVSRAVASLPILLELSLPFCKKGGIFCSYKGPEGINEIKESQKAIEILGSNKPMMHRFELPFKKAERILLLFEKNSSDIPRKYPRKAGIPAKRPL